MKRPLLMLAGVLSALLVVAYLVTLKPGETSVSVTEGERLADIDSGAVMKIEVATPGDEVVLERRGGEWFLSSPLEDKADAAAVGTAIQRASGMIVKGIVSTKPEKHSLFEVDSAGTRVTLTQEGKDPVTLIVGKGSTNFSETYVRRDGSDNVALVDGALTWVFSKPAKDWRSKFIVNIPRTSISSVTYAYGDTVFTLSMTDSLWTIDGEPADQPAVATLLTPLSTLQCDDFLDAPPVQRPSVTITYAGMTVSFRHDAAEKKYYVTRTGDDRSYVLQEWRANQILKRKKDLM